MDTHGLHKANPVQPSRADGPAHCLYWVLDLAVVTTIGLDAACPPCIHNVAGQHLENFEARSTVLGEANGKLNDHIHQRQHAHQARPAASTSKSSWSASSLSSPTATGIFFIVIIMFQIFFIFNFILIITTRVDIRIEPFMVH